MSSSWTDGGVIQKINLLVCCFVKGWSFGDIFVVVMLRDVHGVLSIFLSFFLEDEKDYPVFPWLR